MEFIQHTLNWTKGEILEATIMVCVGVVIIICALLFWKFGTTPYARAIVIPLLVVGVIPIVFGFYGVFTNQKRISYYSELWEKNPQEFIVQEKARVKGFDNIFKYSYPFAIICIISGAIFFFLTKSPIWKSICIALMLLGLMAYILDHFAAERAAIYLNHIEKTIKSTD